MSDYASESIDREIRAADRARYEADVKEARLKIRVLCQGVTALVDGLEDEEVRGLLDVADELAKAAEKMQEHAAALNSAQVYLEMARAAQRRNGEGGDA